MRVLCVAAHPDDETLGAGATLARHAVTGDEVHVLILGTGAAARGDIWSRPKEMAMLREQATSAGKKLGVVGVTVLSLSDNRFDSVDLLDIVKLIEIEIERVRPSLIYTHSAADLNVDHTLTHRAVMVAARPLPESYVKRILAFEVPSSTECGLRVFVPNVFVDVNGEPFLRKLMALECYSGEMRQFPHPRSEDAVTALAKWRGASVGVGEAEAFELLREVQ